MLSRIFQAGPIISSLVALLNLLGVIAIWLANQKSFKKIIQNDLSHVGVALAEIKAEQVCIKDKVTCLSEDVAYLKGSFVYATGRRCKAKAKKKEKK